MNKITAAAVAKVSAVEELNPRVWGWVLVAAGVLLVMSSFQRTGHAGQEEG